MDPHEREVAMSDFGRAVARTGVPAKQIRPGRQMADDPSAFGPQAGFVVGSSVLDGSNAGSPRASCPQESDWGAGIIQICDARGMGILSGLGGDHQCVVAFDLQPAAVEDGVVAEVGIKANIPARLRVLVAHRFVRGVPHQLVQAGDGDQLIPIHPANTPDTLVTRPADTPAQEEVMLSPVETCPGVGAGPVDELPILARLYVRQPSRMNSGVAHQPASLVTLQPRM